MDSKSSGVSFLTVVGIVFVILKLCSVITWAWWIVLLPFIVEIGVLIIFLLVLLICLIHD